MSLAGNGSSGVLAVCADVVLSCDVLAACCPLYSCWMLSPAVSVCPCLVSTGVSCGTSCSSSDIR